MLATRTRTLPPASLRRPVAAARPWHRAAQALRRFWLALCAHAERTDRQVPYC